MEIVRTFVQHQGLRLDDRHDHLDDQPDDDHDHDDHLDDQPGDDYDHDDHLDDHPEDDRHHADHLDDDTDYNHDGDRGDYEHICPTPRFETGP